MRQAAIAELRVALLAAVLAVAAAASTAVPLAAKALYNPELFQGDIKGIAGQEPGNERAAILGSQYLWPNGEVPYVIGNNMTTDQKNTVLMAMNTFTHETCIRFVERTSEANYIEVVNTEDGCWSYVGMYGGRQLVSLDDDGCIYTGTAVHELMHVVGFYHEHCRNDRDSYVTIHYENVIPGQEYNFEKDGYWQYVGEGYSYTSIMHYGPYAFSVDYGDKPTIVPTDPTVELHEPYDKYSLAPSDVNQINNLYADVCASRNKN